MPSPTLHTRHKSNRTTPLVLFFTCLATFAGTAVANKDLFSPAQSLARCNAIWENSDAAGSCSCGNTSANVTLSAIACEVEASCIGIATGPSGKSEPQCVTSSVQYMSTDVDVNIQNCHGTLTLGSC